MNFQRIFKILSRLLFISFAQWSAAAASQLPHILLVMADDQGYGDAGYTGHPFVQTPHMDAMARKAVVFNRFYAAAPVCSPTRASVMTGRTPIRTNVPNHGHYLRPHETTLAEALKQAGYVTGHFGKFHIGSVQPESPTCPGNIGFDEWVSGLNFFDRDPFLSDSGTYRQFKGQGSVISMDETLAFLAKYKDGGKPMFAVTWFPSPHSPHSERPDDENRLYEGKKMQGYFEEITLLDQQLGRLRKALRDMDIADNTLLWYCSDNGGLAEASSGGRERKGSIYEGGLRVPGLLEWPAAFAPRQIDVPAVTSDIYPTLLAITGVTVKNQPRLDGINLLPVIEGKQKSRPGIGFWFGVTGGQSTRSDLLIKTLLEARRNEADNPLPERLLKNVNEFPTYPEDFNAGHAAWNDWPWKLHRIAAKKQKKGDKVNVRPERVELYNLVDDPQEADNLAEQQPDRVARMLKELKAWQRSVLDSHAGADYPAGSIR